MLTTANTSNQRKITIGEPSEYVFKDVQLDKHGNPIETSFDHDSKKSLLPPNSIRKKRDSSSIASKRHAHQFSIVLSEDTDNVNHKFNMATS